MAELALGALGPAAVPCMVRRVIAARSFEFPERMAALRGLVCCFPADQWPRDLLAAFLSEWSYQPREECLPAIGLEIVRLQTPEYHLGINLSWALLRHDSISPRTWYLVFRGSESALDWMENANIPLKGVNTESWGSLLIHGGFWTAVDGDGARLQAALKEVPADDLLVITGGSKGGANALATAIWLLTPRPGHETIAIKELAVVTFGAPNIVGRGSEEHGNSLEHLRKVLRERAPRSRAWAFSVDPVAAVGGARSTAVFTEFRRAGGRPLQLLKWWKPDAFAKVMTWMEQIITVSATLEPVLQEVTLEAPPAVRSRKKFDASVHPQLNYSEALCRQLLPSGSSFRARR